MSIPENFPVVAGYCDHDGEACQCGAEIIAQLRADNAKLATTLEILERNSLCDRATAGKLRCEIAGLREQLTISENTVKHLHGVVDELYGVIDRLEAVRRGYQGGLSCIRALAPPAPGAATGTWCCASARLDNGWSHDTGCPNKPSASGGDAAPATRCDCHDPADMNEPVMPCPVHGWGPPPSASGGDEARCDCGFPHASEDEAKCERCGGTGIDEERSPVCPTCDGTGLGAGRSPLTTKKCAKCEGSGRESYATIDRLSGEFYSPACPACGGRGHA